MSGGDSQLPDQLDELRQTATQQVAISTLPFQTGCSFPRDYIHAQSMPLADCPSAILDYNYKTRSSS
jgi:hypothetical protein